MGEPSGAARAALVAVEASAPGKLILFGEHSVVYGAQAVAGAVSDLRIYVRVTLRPAADPMRPALVIGLPVLESGRPSGGAVPGLESPSSLASASTGGRHLHSMPLRALLAAVRRGQALAAADGAPATTAKPTFAQLPRGETRLHSASAVAGAGLALAGSTLLLAPSLPASVRGLVLATAAAAGAWAGNTASRAVLAAAAHGHRRPRSDSTTAAATHATPAWQAPRAPFACESVGESVASACRFDGPPAGKRLRRLASKSSSSFLRGAAAAAADAASQTEKAAADRAEADRSAAAATLPPLVRQAVVPLAFLVVSALGDVVGLPPADPAVAAAAKAVPGTAQDDEDFDEEDDVDAVVDDDEGGPQPAGVRKHAATAAATAATSTTGGARHAAPAAPLGFQPLDVELELTRSTLPVGSGLGSSAALAVAAAGALLTARAQLECVRRGASPAQLAALRQRSGTSSCGTTSRTATDEECGPAALPPVPGPWLPGSGCTVSLHAVNAWALAAETLFHGTPSGLDNTVATFGGLLRFRKFPAEMKPVVLGGPEAAAKGEALPPELDVVIINTHAPKNTKALVAGVRTLRDAQPDVVVPILSAMDGIARAAVESLEAGSQGGGSRDFGLGRLASANHNLLCAIGVGHPALDAVVSDARDHGLSAKLTGAGGGGCAFALVPPAGHDGSDVDSFEATSARRGFSWFRTRVGGAGGGARIEE